MKRSWLLRLKEWLAKRSKKPWATFETTGPDENGRLPFTIYANPAFINLLKKHGMGATTDEETLQLFFLQTRMVPEEFEDDTINPEGTPNLTNEANQFRRG